MKSDGLKGRLISILKVLPLSSSSTTRAELIKNSDLKKIPLPA